MEGCSSDFLCHYPGAGSEAGWTVQVISEAGPCVGPDVNVTKTEVCKSVKCGTITDASDHFPIYVDVTVGNSSLPLLEEKGSLGSYNVVAEDYQW